MFEPTIGMEIHVQLKSKNKVFSNTKNSFSETPNEFVNLIDLALPGMLPKLNFEVIEMALASALALNCKINKEMHFDRKNYFYPDLPKGYQITQNKTPIGYDGFVEINDDGIIKKIRIERIHIEEDTCKSIHDNSVKLNFNRAGAPLIEIVTKPDIKTSREAVLYLEKIREILLFIGVSDVKIEEGSMRCEANVSIKKVGNLELGTKVEVKNIGSITYAGAAIDYEIKRQEEVLSNGELVHHETRKFDEATKKTVLMRKKESGNDYRYFPEPDLPRVVLSDDFIESVKSKLPLLPDELKEKFMNLGLNENNIKTLIGNIELCNFYISSLDKIDPNTGVNVLTSIILTQINKTKKSIEDLINVDDYINVVNMKSNEEITSSDVKDIFAFHFDGLSMDDAINKVKSSEKLNVDEIINKVLNENPSSIDDYKRGNDRSVKFLMGQIMKEGKGKIDPKDANVALTKALLNLH